MMDSSRDRIACLNTLSQYLIAGLLGSKRRQKAARGLLLDGVRFVSIRPHSAVVVVMIVMIVI